MVRPSRDPRERPERSGEKPLLQGHLKPGGVRPADESRDDAAHEGTVPPARSAQPAEDLASNTNEAEATRGKATKSPAAVATRPHLEGSEQGPM